MLGPDIPGRKVVFIPESTDSMPLTELARGADAIVHCASMEVRASQLLLPGAFSLIFTSLSTKEMLIDA